MQFEEIIGFIISMLAIAFVIGKNIYEEIRKRKHPEEYVKEKERRDSAMRDFMKSIDDHPKKKHYVDEDEDMEPEPYKPPIRKPVPKKTIDNRRPVPRTVKDNFHYNDRFDVFQPKTQVEGRDFKNAIEDRYGDRDTGASVVSSDMTMEDPVHAYEIKKKQPSRAEKLLSGLHSRKDMVVIHEIISTPKGFRK